MTDYSKCKIYKLVGECGGVYIGNTVQTLERRKEKHLSNLNNCVSRSLTNPEIHLLEDYPCNNETEAKIREQFYMDQYPERINYKDSYVTDEQKKERSRENANQYYHNNKEKCKIANDTTRKIRRANNPDKTKQQDSVNNAKRPHKECPHCNKSYHSSYIAKHIRTHSNQIPVSFELEYTSPSDLNAV